MQSPHASPSAPRPSQPPSPGSSQRTSGRPRHRRLLPSGVRVRRRCTRWRHRNSTSRMRWTRWSDAFACWSDRSSELRSRYGKLPRRRMPNESSESWRGTSKRKPTWKPRSLGGNRSSLPRNPVLELPRGQSQGLQRALVGQPGPHRRDLAVLINNDQRG